MNALLRLYPRAWRDRYGDELVALLEDHPLTPLVLIDVIRGALDAHLHPQVRGSAAPSDKELPVNQRLLGAMAAVGGIAWILGIASTYVLPLDIYGERDTSLAVWGVAIGGGLIAISLGELGTRPGSRSWTGHAIAIAGVVFSLTVPLGWPLFIAGLIGLPVVLMLGAARAYRTQRLPTWAVAVLEIATAAGLIGIFGFGGGPLLASIGLVGLVVAFVAWRPLTIATAGPSQEPA